MTHTVSDESYWSISHNYLGENALNLAVRAGLKIYVEKYINRSESFRIIQQKDGSGRDCIQVLLIMTHYDVISD